MPQINVKKGSIVWERVDAIVNPANSYGSMGGGVALAIKRAGGEAVEKEAVSKAPIPVGTAIATTAGKLKAKYVIHAPTMSEPTEKIGLDNVRKAVRAALECAVEIKATSVSIPGLGTGVGGVNKDDAARAMLEEIKVFIEKQKEPALDEINLVGLDDELTEHFKKWTQRLGLETE